MVSGGYCRATCSGASSPSPPPPPAGGCADIAPPSYTCAQQKEWGKCGEGWMVGGGFCAATCGRCGGGGRKLAGSSGAAAYGAVLSGARRAKKVKGDDVDDVEAVSEDTDDCQRRKLAGSSGAAAYGAILAGARSVKKVKADDTDDYATATEAADPATRRRLAATDPIMDEAGGFQLRGSSSIGPCGRVWARQQWQYRRSARVRRHRHAGRLHVRPAKSVGQVWRGLDGQVLRCDVWAVLRKKRERGGPCFIDRQ